MAVCIFLFAFFSQTASSSDIISIFPPYYSQYYSVHFDRFNNETAMQLTDAVLGGEEKHTTFGISLWVKIIDPRKSGGIFWLEYGKENFLQFPCIFYAWKSSTTSYLYLSVTNEDERLSLLITPSDNWVFIAFSASYEKKLLLFYCNNLGTESFNSGILEKEVILSNAVLLFGIQNFIGRIGDFKVHNNIFNEISDWSLQYSTSCVEVSCTSLFPIIEYGKCDRSCESQPETFLPIFQPTLYSKTPYMTIYKYSYFYNPWKECNDFSVTGWLQVSACQNRSETILEISNNGQSIIIEVKLKSSSLLAHCDVLEATIYSFENKTDDSVQLISSNYIGNWFFFAITLNSTAKLFTLYSQNSISAPSASFPLISSSITYDYSVLPLVSFSWIVIGGNHQEVYPGNYADFRFYPDNAIDNTLMQYNNNIFSAATYLDPHCTLWESIWYCKACEIGYFVKNGICNKCHPSCDGCSSDDTEANCLACASGYYAQPGHPSLCFNYCPLGFVKDSYLNQCAGIQGVIANINFDNNLSGDFISSYVYIKFGELSDEYYPKFNFWDPLPANKRGIFIHFRSVEIISQSPTQEDRLFSSDFTIEIWSLVNNPGALFHATHFNKHNYYGYDLGSLWTLYFGFEMFDEKISLHILRRDGSQERVISPLESSSEWALYSVSLTYDDITKSTKILFVINKNSYTAIVSSHYKEIPGMIHKIGNLNGNSFIGFLYSLAMHNYGKTYNEILPSLGTCDSCSACPGILKSCLPTCGETEYVDENGNCQKCPSECSWICSRAGTCNLCYDDLCYKCTKYEIGACTQCVENAVLSSGQCECQSGYIKQGSQCVEKCSDGFYLDSGSQSCLSCPENCLKCMDQNSCMICKSGFFPQHGKCECAAGYFADSSNNCLKCGASCLTCSIRSSNCTSCPLEAPIIYSNNKCYPCDIFEGYSKNQGITISDFTEDLFEKLSKNCAEICGDGKNMGQAECDDGNRNNGDGCSSNCLIEFGWNCFGGNATFPDSCKDETPPSPILTYLSQNDRGYLLTLSFSEAVTFGAEISEIIEIEIAGIINFDWSISLDDSIYIIALEIYENVDSKMNVTVNFIDPSAIVDMRGLEMKERLVKTNLMHSFVYESGNLIEKAIDMIAISAVVASSVGSAFSGYFVKNFDNQALWSMIEMMQMQYFLIFLSPKYPGNLLSYISTLSISNGSFLPNPFQWLLAGNIIISDTPESYPKDLFIGQFLLLWLATIIGLPTSLLLFKLYPRVSIVRWLRKSYLFSILLRVGIFSFLEITLLVFLKWREALEQDQDINYISLILGIIGTLYIVLTFALIIWQVALKSEEKLTEKLHLKRLGTLYEAFKNSSKTAASFILFQNIRRVFFIAFCVFLYGYPTLQVALSALLSLIYIASLVILKPFKAKVLGNHLHIASEALHFSAHCLMFKLLDHNLSSNNRKNFGWIITTLLCLSLLLHAVALFTSQINKIAQVLKQLKEKLTETSSSEPDPQDELKLNS